ncbi:MAG: DUF2299 family protein [Planctomycetota bacterium]
MDWLHKIWDKLATEIIGGLVVAGLLAIGTVIWALIQSWAAPLIIVIFIGTFGLTLFSLNQYRLWRKRRSIQIERIEPMVRNWLYKNGFTIQNDPRPISVFQFVARDAQGRPVVVCQLKNELFLTLGAQLLVSKEDQQRLDPITGDENSTLLEDLKIEMVRFGVGFLGIDHPLRAITVEEKVPCDDTLTELAFLQRVMFVRRVQMLIGEFLRRAMKLSTQT